ncbi:MarR family winged helix-turn-helix transcriptional regulator [Psychromicrobium lacuslunae]|uniref:HTH marR-type domain-containing protein n=1 Tax=Psychromicrobium lacuslunae TaxID=1618207 RepID=A0A0D4C148_9MICC|nr:MarR family transcriptional regulator [Psychromicrobium lacuslunae]AJT42318.1 hypothetical protein UM93_13955 [Psychromicrobium lacuslunae]
MNQQEIQQSQLELTLLLRELTVQADRFVEVVSSRHGLHRTHLNALGVLSKSQISGEAVTAGKLGHELGLSSPATTALVDRLDRAGHVERKRDAVDRRQVHIVSTPPAQEMGRRLFSPLAEQMRRSMSNYSEDQLALVRQFIDDMISATKAAQDEVSKTPVKLEPSRKD